MLLHAVLLAAAVLDDGKGALCPCLHFCSRSHIERPPLPGQVRQKGGKLRWLSEHLPCNVSKALACRGRGESQCLGTVCHELSVHGVAWACAEGCSCSDVIRTLDEGRGVHGLGKLVVTPAASIVEPSMQDCPQQPHRANPLHTDAQAAMDQR